MPPPAALGVSHDDAVEGLMTFPGLAHRMETVGQLGRVRFVNDSKATNADAARQALSSLSERSTGSPAAGPRTGGIDDLADLFPRVAKAYLIGEAARGLRRDAERHGRQRRSAATSQRRRGRRLRRRHGRRGEDAVVLLSPACASFDQFPTSRRAARPSAPPSATSALAQAHGRAAA